MSRVLLPVAAIAVLIGVVVAAILTVAGVPLVIAVLVGLVVGAAFFWLVPRRADQLIVRGLPVADLTEARAPRVYNVIDGLCDTYGYRRPTVTLIDSDAMNAVAYGRQLEQPVLALSRGLIDGLDRMQLEGVLARELALLNDDSRVPLTAAVAMSPFVPSSMVRRAISTLAGEEAAVRRDMQAAQLTRYPPGLAAALQSISERGARIEGANGAARHLWLVDPLDAGGTTDGWALEARVDALREL